MSKGPLDDRRQALEEAFFKKENERLMQRLREERDQENERAALGRACGISDEALLDTLLAQGVRAESVAALVLVPQVTVAWADGTLSPGERTAILESADQAGTERSSPAYELLEHWLEYAPAEQLFKTWELYVNVLCETLEQADRKRLADDILARSKKVAQAAGFVLKRTSSEEQAVLDRIKAAFES